MLLCLLSTKYAFKGVTKTCHSKITRVVSFFVCLMKCCCRHGFLNPLSELNAGSQYPWTLDESSLTCFWVVELPPIYSLFSSSYILLCKESLIRMVVLKIYLTHFWLLIRLSSRKGSVYKNVGKIPGLVTSEFQPWIWIQNSTFKPRYDQDNGRLQPLV